tara:strand:- start:1132 stop:1425 length:294 start_codon:yes stop_codon:yes gene_type:complete
MDFAQMALEVFENKLFYKDDEYVTILNILMESYNKAKGIVYDSKMDLKQEVVQNECETCGCVLDEEGDDQCVDCVGEDKFCDDEINDCYTGNYIDPY